MLERGETTLLDDIELWDGWNEEEEEYFNKKLEDLTEKSIELDNGCLIHYKSIEGDPSRSVNCNKPERIGGNRSINIYRFVAICIFGDSVLDLVVRHKCRTKYCYNPNHIELGTQYDNSMDQFRDNTISTNLNENQVKNIYENREGLKTSQLAKLYNVSKHIIWAINNGRTWNHVTGLPKSRIIINKEECKKKILDNKKKYLSKLKENINIDENGCWNWLLSKKGDYGHITINNLSVSSHVASWSLANGRFPNKGEVVRHMCNKNKNKLCCNPDHLKIGSYSDNMRDRDPSEMKTKAILSTKEVLEIIEILDKETSNTIADKYGVSENAIVNIKNGKTWTDVTNIKPVIPNKDSILNRTVNQKEASEIVELLKSKNIAEIAKLYNVSDKLIEDIRKGRKWGHISNLDNGEKIISSYKITEKDVLDILELSKKYSNSRIAKIYNVNDSTISAILLGRSRNNVTNIKKKINFFSGHSKETIANIKYIINLNKYKNSAIASLFNINRKILDNLERDRFHKDVEPILNEEGRNILKMLEKNEEYLKLNKCVDDNDVSDIKFILKIGNFQQKEIAEVYGINKLIISRIFTGKTYNKIGTAKILSEKGKRKLSELEKIFNKDLSERKDVKTEYKARINDEMIADIKLILKIGDYNPEEIADVFKINKSIISSLVGNKTYKDIEAADDLSADGDIKLKELSKNREIIKEEIRKNIKSPTRFHKRTIADIKYILNLDEFKKEDIMEEFLITRDNINRIINGTRYFDIEIPTILSVEGNKSLKKLRRIK